ncbi:MAG: hypothetical protein QCI38_08385, partial [Candidatus Thermoplasmatota archaeon]|nr:hypothetical protein [Candidatus Thermoplasmatota archaeon]
KNDTQSAELQTWFDLRATPATGENYIPEFVRLNASTTDPRRGFDHIILDGTGKLNASIRFCEDKTNVTYAIIDVIDVPTNLEVKLERKTVEMGNITVFWFNSSDGVSYLQYKGFEYVKTRVGRITESTPFRHVYVEMKNVPTRLYMEGTFDFGEEMESPSTGTNRTGLNALPGNFVNSLILNIMSRFSRISRTISSIPDKILEAAGGGGYFVMDASGPLDISFLLTDSVKPWTSDDRLFFAFANSTATSKQVDMIVAGRMTGLRRMEGLIGENTRANLEMEGQPDLYGYYLDSTRDFIGKLVITKIPDRIYIDVKPSDIYYEGSISNNSFRYVSRKDDVLMKMEISNLPGELRMKRSDDGIVASTSMGAIGDLRVLITNGTPASLEGNHIYVNKNPQEMSVSMGIGGLTGFAYNQSSGDLSIDTIGGGSLKVFLSSEEQEQPDILLKALIDPLPSHFSANMPSNLNMTEIEFPDVSVDEGILSLPNMLFAISSIGSEMVGTLHGMFSGAVESIGATGTD